jgi:DNA-binding transcriptional ArsR family regulator
MTNLEDEYYSTIFVALKHPIRRKILRMLHEKPRSFSEMLGKLKIESAHLTYHLDTLGDLLSKTEKGEYMLSFIGEAATSMMYQVEGTPKAFPHFLSLPRKWKVCFSALMIGLIIFSAFSYVQYQKLNKLSAEYESLSETLSDLLFSAYHKDIQAAVQRWIQVHGTLQDGIEIKPCYINTGTLAAWIDPENHLQLVPEGYYGPQWPRGSYWDCFPYPTWCKPPEAIAVWVQLYNKSNGLWFPKEKVLSRKLGEFACYLINTSDHKVIGIDGYYATTLEQDFWHNSLPNLLGTYNYGLTSFRYGIGYGYAEDNSWGFELEIKLKDTEQYCYLMLIIDWNMEIAKVHTLMLKTD